MGACFEPGHMMIVTELLPLGDFKGLLYSKELDLSLFTRVRMMTGEMNFSTWMVCFSCLSQMLLEDSRGCIEETLL